jgi:membrane-bound serine protease (ClpP class)
MSQLPVSLMLGVFAAGGIIFVFLLRMVLRTKPSGVEVLPSRMIGLKGRALTEVECEGRVMVQGEYWWARARERIAAGESVRVAGIDGMMLEVEPYPDTHMGRRAVSAVATSDTELQ